MIKVRWKWVGVAVLALVVLLTSQVYPTMHQMNEYDKTHPQYIVRDPLETMALSVPKGTRVVHQFDDHGGFHGDGTYMAEYQLSTGEAKSFVDSLLRSGKWQSGSVPRETWMGFVNPDATTTGSFGIPGNGKDVLYYYQNLAYPRQTVFDVERMNHVMDSQSSDPQNNRKDDVLLDAWPYHYVFGVFDREHDRLYVERVDV